MTSDKKKDSKDKHGAGEQPDSAIKNEIRKRAKAGELPCAVAFTIASALHVPAASVGRTADLIKIRLVKCQMGLFGYSPEKKIVTPKPPAHPDLESAVREALVNDRLPCRSAWEIAARLDIPKMAVSAACEYLGIKIKPCQLGAF